MPSKNIRKVILPKLKFHATNYHHMIDWDTELKTEPPFLTSLSDEEVLGILEKPLSVPKWPNHTQSVERGIRVMIEACQRWQATRQEMVTSGSGLAADGLCLHLEPRSISASIIN